MSKNLVMPFMILMVVFSISLCGCAASFKKNMLEEQPANLGLSSQGKKPSVTIPFKVTSSNDNTDIAEITRKMFQLEYNKVLRESGCFSELGGKDSDIQIQSHLEVRISGGNKALGILSLITLNVIPVWNTHHYRLTAKVVTKDKNEREYVLEDGVTTITWIFMIAAYPFAKPAEVRPEVRMNMYRQLLAHMQQDGVL